MNPNSVSITLVTTCMGRLAFLQRTLPTWIRNTSFPIVIVDYSCPEGTGDWVESRDFGGRVTVVRKEAERREERPVFNAWRSRNAGAVAVSEGFVFFLDCDSFLEPGFEEWLRPRVEPGAMFAVVPENERPYDLWGVLVVAVEAFRAVGRYDEGVDGHGHGDSYLRIMLHRHGLKCYPIPMRFIPFIEHSNELRSKYHGKGIRAAHEGNLRYLDAKMLRLTGRTYRAWRRDKTLDIFYPHRLEKDEARRTLP